MKRELMVTALIMQMICFVPALARAERFTDKELFEQGEKDWNSRQWESAYNKLLKLTNDTPKSPYAGKAYLKMALHLKDKKLYQEAIDVNKKVINEFPGSYEAAEAESRIGCVYKIIGDRENALKYYERALEKAQDWQQVKYASGWIKWLRFNREWAEKRLCGPKSLAYILEQYGQPIVLEEINVKLSGKKEISLYDLAELAREYGLSPRGVRMEVNRVRKSILPLLMFVPPDHFSVLTRLDRREATIYDPAHDGIYRCSRKELAKLWPGEGLIFSPRFSGRKTVYLSLEEMKEIKGGHCYCCPFYQRDDPEEEKDYPDDHDRNGPDQDKNPDDDEPDRCRAGRGFPRIMVRLNVLSLYLKDSPIFYNPGTGPYMSFDLTYNSDSDYTGIFGNGWFSNYTRYITVQNGMLNSIDASGGETIYVPDENSNWNPTDLGIEDTVAENGNVFVLETFPGRIRYYFDTGGNITGKLTAVEDTWGKQVKFYYDGSQRLTKIVDATGNGVDETGFKLVLDENGLVTKVEDPLNRSAYFYYSPGKCLTKIIDMAGYATTLGYNGYDYLISMYTPPGGGNPWQFDYCFYGYYYTKIIDPMGQDRRRYTHIFSPNLSNKVFDANGHSRSFKWDYLNDTTKINYYYNDDEYYEIGRYYNDDSRALTRTTNANGKNTDYAYGDRGLLTMKTDALNNVTTYYYDPSSYDLTRFSRKDNHTYYSYGTHHEITAVVYPDGSSERFYFDSSIGKITKKVDRRGNATQFLFDTDGYLTKTIDPNNNSTAYINDGVGRLLTMIDAENNSTSFQYDNLDRINCVVYPDSNESQYFYSCCQLTKVKDANDKETAYFYDANSRLRTVIDAAGKATSYAYDPAGNLTAVTDAENRTTAYSYDALNRLTRMTFADSTYETYAFDGVGNLTRKQDAAGNQKYLFYDDLNRLVKEEYKAF